MINNKNSVLTTLSVKYWSGFKYDKGASQRTIDDNHMEKGAGNFNKKLLPKFVLQDIKTVITQFKYFFNENTLPYDALLGTRILPTTGFMAFQKEVVHAQGLLKKAIHAFVDDYEENRKLAATMLGDLYNPADYPTKEVIASRFGINVDYLPVPEAEAFNDKITNVQVQRLNDQLTTMSLDAKYDLVARTEKVAATLMDTLKNDKKRIYNSTVIHNIDKLSEQLGTLNYDNDVLLVEIKECVDENIKNIRVDYLKESRTYRTKIIKQTQIVIDLIDSISE